MQNNVKTVLLLGALTGLLLGIGQLLAGPTGLTIAITFSIVMNLGAYWFSDKIVLAMYKARKAKKTQYPKLHSIIEKLAKTAKLPKPKVYIIPTATPNAFATGRNPKHATIAATEGILHLLNDEELTGVLAHELGHVKNRDILITTIAATIAGVISYTAAMARWAAIFGGGRDNEGAGGLISILTLSIITPIIAMILQLALSRSREYLADEASAKISKKPKALANALRKLQTGNKTHPLKGNPATASMFIINPFTAKGMMTLLSTHPPLDERIKRLEQMKV